MEIPLRTAYGQNGRCGMQPKAKHSLRAQAQLMRTKTVETFELVKGKPKLLREKRRTRECPLLPWSYGAFSIDPHAAARMKYLPYICDTKAIVCYRLLRIIKTPASPYKRAMGHKRDTQKSPVGHMLPKDHRFSIAALDPVQSKDLMTVGNLAEGLS
ncbi:hypothetical protein TNCV_2360341 [Trichonephila clavipes]|nr:hypothetical protein TNCV_2360341 [Trichonephila clavipes]